MIAHIDIDAFFASVEVLLNPSLKGKPVVVGGSPEGAGVVASASYEARAFGIRSAMPMSKALRLCPKAIRVDSHFHEYGRYSEQVMSIFDRYSPIVEVVSVDEAYLDLAGTERLHGHPTDVACRIHAQVRAETGLSVSVGLAANPMMSKIASDLAKPAGMLYVMPGFEAGLLGPLDVQRIPGIGPSAADRLAQLGVATVGQLRGLDLPLLRRTFGVWGMQLYDAARGIDPRRIGGEGVRKSISRETTFAPALTDMAEVERILLGLLSHVTVDLRSQQLTARCVTVKLRYSDFDTHTASRTLHREGSEDIDFREAMIDLLRKLRTRTLPVRLVGVGLSDLSDATRQQGDLFDTQRGVERRRSITKMIDEMNQRFGEGAVGRGARGLSRQ